ncbi:MAG: glycosyltransferase [Gammaproteobacteria bacterium]
MKLKASCFCATYGRPHLLEEAIESFLRQDYDGPKELVVLNDYTRQRLSFDHPEVKIINASQRITPLGKKFNATVALCSGDVLFPWDDDDIYLPWRISYSISHLRNGIFHTDQAWQDDGNGLYSARNLFQCNLAVSREKWQQVRGYLEADFGAIDRDLYRRLKAEKSRQEIPRNKLFYIYRWGGSDSYHASFAGGYRHGVSQATENYLSEQERLGRVSNGQIELKPHWTKDWTTLSRQALKTDESSGGMPTSRQQSPAMPASLRPCHKGFSLDDTLVVRQPGSSGLAVLNPLAKLIWEGLLKGLTVECIAELIADTFSISYQDAFSDVRGIIYDWQYLGLVRDHQELQWYRIGSRVIAIEGLDDVLNGLIAPALTHFRCTPCMNWNTLLRVIREEDSWKLMKNDEVLFSNAYPDAIAGRLIYEVIEESYRHAPLVTVLHAAALQWNDRRVVLPSRGGAGKTTLAAAMMHEGATYLADDIVPLLDENGSVAPIKTSLCIKEGSIPLLKSRYPDIRKLPVLYRNGMAVRYLPPKPSRNDTGVTKADIIVFPNRRTGSTASVTRLTAAEAFGCMVNSSPWFQTSSRAKSSIADDNLQKIIDWVARTPAFEMQYDTLDQGVATLFSIMEG